MGAFTKRWIIQKRRTRRQKLDKLRKRYVAAHSDAEEHYLGDHFGLDENPNFSPRWNIAPTQLVPAIRQDRSARGLFQNAMAEQTGADNPSAQKSRRSPNWTCRGSFA